MLRKSIRSSILIMLKRKLSIKENFEGTKLSRNSLASQTSLSRLLLSPSKQLIRKSTKIGVQIKLFMKSHHSFPTMRFLLAESQQTMQPMFPTQLKNWKSQMELVWQPQVLIYPQTISSELLLDFLQGALNLEVARCLITLMWQLTR